MRVKRNEIVFDDEKLLKEIEDKRKYLIENKRCINIEDISLSIKNKLNFKEI